MTIATAANKLARQLRNEVASIPTYWNKPSEAISHINCILSHYNLQVAELISWDDYQETYSRLFRICTIDTAEEIDNAGVRFSWYRLQSGRYEITAYVS